MALPVLNNSTYNTIIPSTGKQVEYRPYLVKEEKILMIAMESQDDKQILGALKDVIKSCILTEDVNINSLAMFDIEALFLKLRSKSVGESTEVKVKCTECESENVTVIPFDDITIPTLDKNANQIELTKDVGMVLNYPTVSDVQNSNIDLNSFEGVMDLLVNCIDTIYDEAEIYSAKDESKKNLKSFVESLNAEQFGKLTKFFENLPALTYNVKFECMNCGHHNDIELKGLNSFFT